MRFDFNREKNEILYRERGITFYQIIEAISENGVLRNVKHPNADKFPNQWMMIVNCNNYTYCVPYVIDGDTY
ncbi:MAG: toxin, partial [Spirochaetales bacterium]|nr:toxin [Spirochaetales bacterium]